MYQSKNTLVSVAVFGQMITRDILHLLFRFLYFTNNSNYNGNDLDRNRLYKIREVTQDENVFRCVLTRQKAGCGWKSCHFQREIQLQTVH